METDRPRARKEQELEREHLILRAALTELALFDYGGMTIEDVARRAGVNKTTVYRKWPTKFELVRDALQSVFEMFSVGSSAGELRTDLRRVASQLIAFIESSEGRSLVRLRLLQHPEPELAEIAEQLRARKVAELTALVELGVERGELAAGVDIKLLLDVLWGVLFVRLVFNREAVEAAALERILDLLLCAAKPQSPDAQAKSKSRQAKRRR